MSHDPLPSVLLRLPRSIRIIHLASTKRRRAQDLDKQRHCSLKCGSLRSSTLIFLDLQSLHLLQCRSPNVNEAIGPSSSSRTTGPYTRSLFEFCRIAHPDGPFTPVREGRKDVFPRTAFVSHLEQLYILLWLQRCLMYLGMCDSVMIDVQCFRINRLAKMSRNLWQFELKSVLHIIPDEEGMLLLWRRGRCYYQRRLFKVGYLYGSIGRWHQ